MKIEPRHGEPAILAGRNAGHVAVIAQVRRAGGRQAEVRRRERSPRRFDIGVNLQIVDPVARLGAVAVIVPRNPDRPIGRDRQRRVPSAHMLASGFGVIEDFLRAPDARRRPRAIQDKARRSVGVRHRSAPPVGDMKRLGAIESHLRAWIAAELILAAAGDHLGLAESLR
jgi:hypothetical protein